MTDSSFNQNLICNRSQPNRNEAGRSTGASVQETKARSSRAWIEFKRSACVAVREDSQLSQFGGPAQIYGRLTQMVQNNRQLSIEKSVLFGSSKWIHRKKESVDERCIRPQLHPLHPIRVILRHVQ